MKPEVKAVWTEALRSGTYPQTIFALCGTLDGTPAYCCLGVLCEIYRLQNPLSTRWGDGDEFEIGDDGTGNPIDSSYDMLPLTIQLWAGLDSANGKFEASPNFVSPVKINPNFPGMSLVNLNDSGATFAQIADIIEREF